MQPKGAEPWASAPLGFAGHTAPITFPDRNAVPSRAMRCRRDVRVTEPRGGSCSGGTRGVARFPGERSLALGTPELYDASPLGLNGTNDHG